MKLKFNKIWILVKNKVLNNHKNNYHSSNKNYKHNNLINNKHKINNNYKITQI